jgi:hypothetical protein
MSQRSQIAQLFNVERPGSEVSRSAYSILHKKGSVDRRRGENCSLSVTTPCPTKSQPGCPPPSQPRERSRALRASLDLVPPVRVTLPVKRGTRADQEFCLRASLGVAELLIFHPVDTIAKRLMSNKAKVSTLILIFHTNAHDSNS